MDKNSKPAHAAPPAKSGEGERLQNVLSHRGVASRRHAADMIARGEVAVNGQAVTEPGFRVHPGADEIRVRGELLAAETEQLRTVLLYKPRGLICGAGGRLPLEDDPGAPLANFANRFIENEVARVGPFSGTQYGANWMWGGGWDSVVAGLSVIPMDLGVRPGGGTNGPARIVGNCFQNNGVFGARIGAGVSGRAADTLFLRTAFYDVARPLVDKGQRTRSTEAATIADDAYTPERGPIR